MRSIYLRSKDHNKSHLGDLRTSNWLAPPPFPGIYDYLVVWPASAHDFSSCFPRPWTALQTRRRSFGQWVFQDVHSPFNAHLTRMDHLIRKILHQLSLSLSLWASRKMEFIKRGEWRTITICFKSSEAILQRIGFALKPQEEVCPLDYYHPLPQLNGRWSGVFYYQQIKGVLFVSINKWWVYL